MDLNLGRLAQIAYPVADVDRSATFFEGMLGLKLLLRPHADMAFFDLGGGVALFLERADDPSKASIIYLTCDDVAVATAELKRRGVKVISEPHRITEQPAYDLWMSFIEDPDGHVLGLSMQAPKGWKPA
ncbi:MAG TPA: VOC family protein [Caulobacteraceae bacterium]|nr:VOC family protein [Caulobacteraceae bacterium]